MSSAGTARNQEIGSPGIEQRIRERAYELYSTRAGGTGSELEDWLEAEREIRAIDNAAGHESQTPAEPLA